MSSAERHRPVRQPLCERPAFHQLHDERPLFDAKISSDVRMIERSQDAHLALEA